MSMEEKSGLPQGPRDDNSVEAVQKKLRDIEASLNATGTGPPLMPPHPQSPPGSSLWGTTLMGIVLGKPIHFRDALELLAMHGVSVASGTMRAYSSLARVPGREPTFRDSFLQRARVETGNDTAYEQIEALANTSVEHFLNEPGRTLRPLGSRHRDHEKKNVNLDDPRLPPLARKLRELGRKHSTPNTELRFDPNLYRGKKMSNPWSQIVIALITRNGNFTLHDQVRLMTKVGILISFQALRTFTAQFERSREVDAPAQMLQMAGKLIGATALGELTTLAQAEVDQALSTLSITPKGGREPKIRIKAMPGPRTIDDLRKRFNDVSFISQVLNYLEHDSLHDLESDQDIPSGLFNSYMREQNPPLKDKRELSEHLRKLLFSKK